MNFLKAPVDDEGFIVSFDVAEGEKIREFFDQYGFVCVKDVLNEQEIKETHDYFFSLFDRDDDQSIESFFSQHPFAKFGVIGAHADFSNVSIKNRQNPKVHEAFSAIYGEKELIVDHDRFGALRPTAKHPSWKTIDRWLHLDCNPVTGAVAVESFANGQDLHDWSDCFLVQGFISLTDAREEDGGFHCVPGGHEYAMEWAEKTGKQGSTLVVNQDDPIRHHIQKISIRRGCLFVWNSFLFHANRPNSSANWRLVQYIRMYPAYKTPFQPLDSSPYSYPQGNLTSLGKRLFGIEPWID